MSGTRYNSSSKENEKQPLTASYTPSSLQLKLQQQRDRVRKAQTANSGNSITITNAPKKTSLLSVTRLHVPKSSGYQKINSSPLVQLDSDSEDELFLSTKHATSARHVNKQLSRQLAKDGFQLDEVSDDEELDLIPPSDFRDAGTCTCCNAFNISCAIL